MMKFTRIAPQVATSDDNLTVEFAGREELRCRFPDGRVATIVIGDDMPVTVYSSLIMMDGQPTSESDRAEIVDIVRHALYVLDVPFRIESRT